jgi:hypothetical protein
VHQKKVENAQSPVPGLPDFSWCYIPKRRENVPNAHKWLLNIPKGHKIYQYFPFQGPSKFPSFRIFGLRINHLATLLGY